MSQNEIKQRISNMITNYLLSCDLIVSLFYASVFSDRFDSRTNPFPPAYVDSNRKKSIKSLRKVLNEIPPLTIVGKVLQLNQDFEYFKLLDWLFSVVDPSTLELTEIADLHLPIDQQPQLVFAIKTCSAAEKVWCRNKRQKNTLHAFYGTNVENLYSTVKHGLNPNFSTTTEPLYGAGLYLTNQMGVSLLFSPFKGIWKYSMLGEKLRALVLCEVIDDPSKIKRLQKEQTLNELANSSYMIVKDKNYVRIKYFFVYTKNSPRNSILSTKNKLQLMYLVFIMIILICFYINKNILEDMLGYPLFK